jgi:hypothetical protein
MEINDNRPNTTNIVNKAGLQNMCTNMSLYESSLSKLLVTINETKAEIFQRLNNISEVVDSEYTKFSIRANFFQEIASKKIVVLENEESCKAFNFNTSILEEMKIYERDVNEALELVDKMEGARTYMCDLLQCAIDQKPEIDCKPSEFNHEEIEQNYLSNNLYNYTQTQNPLTEIENIGFDLNSCTNQNTFHLDHKEEDHGKLNSIIDNILEQNKVKVPRAVNICAKLSKKVRKLYLDGYYQELIYSSKYDGFWNSFQKLDFCEFAHQIKNWARSKGYDEYANYSWFKMVRILKEKIRYKYTWERSVDFYRPGRSIVDEIKSQMVMKWVKFKIVPKKNVLYRKSKIRKLANRYFKYYFYNIGKNSKPRASYCIYGQIHSVDSMSRIIWTHAESQCFDYVAIKGYTFEEDLFSNLELDDNWETNMTETFSTKMIKRAQVLEDLRKEYARIVLAYIAL